MKQHRFLVHSIVILGCLGSVFYVAQNCKPMTKSNLAESDGGPENLELYVSDQSYKDYLCQQDTKLCNAISALGNVLGGRWSFLEQEEMIGLLRSGVFEIENPMFAVRQVPMNLLRPAYLTLMESSKAPYDYLAQKNFGPSRVVLPFLLGNASTTAKPIPANELPEAHSIYVYTEEPTFVFGIKSPENNKPNKTILMTLIPKALTKMATESQRLQFASLDQSARWSRNPKDWVYAVIARVDGNRFNDNAYTKLQVDLMNGRLLQTELEKQVQNMEVGRQQEIALGWAASIALSGGVSAWLAYGLGVGTSVVSNISTAKERGYTLAGISIARDVATAGLFTKYKTVAVVASGLLAANYALRTYAFLENSGAKITTLDKLDFAFACVEILSSLYVGVKLGLPMLKKFQKLTEIDGKPITVTRDGANNLTLTYAERLAAFEADITPNTAPVLPAAERFYAELFGDNYKNFINRQGNNFSAIDTPQMKDFIGNKKYRNNDLFVYDGGETWVSKDGRTIVHETHGDIDIIIAPGRSKGNPENPEFLAGRYRSSEFSTCDTKCHSIGVNKAGYVFGDDRYHAQHVLEGAH